MTQNMKKELECFAIQIRIGIIEAVKAAGSGHLGGAMSIADLLAVLYGSILNIRPKEPRWPERDKVVCSKGHAGPALYAALGQKGFFPYHAIQTLNMPGTHFPSHCDRNKTPGIDMTTGSLGQGTSLAVGMALGDRLRGYSSRTFLIVGDGELQEGQVWEAAMFTGAKNISNLVWIIDNNKRQLDGYTNSVIDLMNIAEKFRSFGMDAVTVPGHDVEAIYSVISKPADNCPRAIILDTVKGHGISEIENTINNHSMAVSAEQCDEWIARLQRELEHIRATETEGGYENNI